MASDDRIVHEAYTVCAPASLPVQIESLACYGSYVNTTPAQWLSQNQFRSSPFFFLFFFRQQCSVGNASGSSINVRR